jgi:hypothetical protein
MKHVFIGEYNGSYTGGSRAWVSPADDVLLGFGEAEDRLITDQRQNDLYRLSKIPCSTYGPGDGVPLAKFVETVTKMFTGEFLQEVLEAVESPNSSNFPGHSGRVRIDWLCTRDFEAEDGLYIVAHYPVSDDVPIGVVSDTYYMA